VNPALHTVERTALADGPGLKMTRMCVGQAIAYGPKIRLVPYTVH